MTRIISVLLTVLAVFCGYRLGICKEEIRVSQIIEEELHNLNIDDDCRLAQLLLLRSILRKLTGGE